MIIKEFFEILDKYAIDYSKEAPESIERNRHMNEISKDEIIDKRISDAIIVDFINFIGMRMGIDYAMYTSDLNK